MTCPFILIFKTKTNMNQITKVENNQKSIKKQIAKFILWDLKRKDNWKDFYNPDLVFNFLENKRNRLEETKLKLYKLNKQALITFWN